MTKQTIDEIRKNDTKVAVEFNNIQFTSCNDTIHDAPPNTIFIYDMICGMHINGPHLRLSRLTDGGPIYEIVNDTVCMQYPLRPYPMEITINDFAIEKISDERFCTVYINK
jgi:hypothetical protein